MAVVAPAFRPPPHVPARPHARRHSSFKTSVLCGTVAAGGQRLSQHVTLRRSSETPATWRQPFKKQDAEVQEVLGVLKEVKDPAMGDIVSCGFVSGIKADRVTGNISLQLAPCAPFQLIPWLPRRWKPSRAKWRRG